METIFGMSGCFPVSKGQEIKDLTASSGLKENIKNPVQS
jgi:hypothetical protein